MAFLFYCKTCFYSKLGEKYIAPARLKCSACGSKEVGCVDQGNSVAERYDLRQDRLQEELARGWAPAPGIKFPA